MIIALVILSVIVIVLCYMAWEIKDRFDRHQSTINESLYDMKQMMSRRDSEVRIIDRRVLDAHDVLIRTEKLNSKYQDWVNDAINQIYFRLDNKPLYEVGNKVDKDWIVTAVDLVSHPKMQYNYTATNIKTGETKTWAE